LELTVGQNWFEHHQAVWEQILLPILGTRDPVCALELGSWEGASAVWILSNLCNGPSLDNQLICVDHFDLMHSFEGKARFNRMLSNLAETNLQDRVRILGEFTIPAMMKLMIEFANSSATGFHFVYIDASHRSDDVLLDAELAWRCTEERGIMVFDDYQWTRQPHDSIQHPRRGIDAFLAIHSGEYCEIHRDYQVIIEKLVHRRLGFVLTKKQAELAVWDPVHQTVR